MALTFTAQADPSNTGNVAQAGTVSITLSPTTAVITMSPMLPGDSATGVINVSNTGTVDCFYTLSADWAAATGTTSRLATVLANKLNASVAVGATSLFTGKLVDLRDQPSPARALTLATGNEDVSITLALPSGTGNIVQGVGLNVDFVFVASSTQ